MAAKTEIKLQKDRGPNHQDNKKLEKNGKGNIITTINTQKERKTSQKISIKTTKNY